MSISHDSMRVEWRFDIMLYGNNFYSILNWAQAENQEKIGLLALWRDWSSLRKLPGEKTRWKRLTTLWIP